MSTDIVTTRRTSDRFRVLYHMIDAHLNRYVYPKSRSNSEVRLAEVRTSSFALTPIVDVYGDHNVKSILILSVRDTIGDWICVWSLPCLSSSGAHLACNKSFVEFVQLPVMSERGEHFCYR